MNTSNFIIAFLLLLALILTFLFSPIPALADDNDCWAEYAWAECDNGVLFDGYWWRSEGWVPGMITRQSHFTPAPDFTNGWAVYYAQGIMEATARYMGFDLTDYIDGVAMMSCADIGQTVWIRRVGNKNWEGPFLVVDCAEWDDHYPITKYRGEVVEVGFTTAERWGIIEEWKTSVEVLKSRFKPPTEFDYNSISYRDWFLEVVQFYPRGFSQLEPRPIFTNHSPVEWYIGGRWISYLAWDNNPLYIESWIRDLIYRKD